MEPVCTRDQSHLLFRRTTNDFYYYAQGQPPIPPHLIAEFRCALCGAKLDYPAATSFRPFTRPG